MRALARSRSYARTLKISLLPDEPVVSFYELLSERLGLKFTRPPGIPGGNREAASGSNKDRPARNNEDFTSEPVVPSLTRRINVTTFLTFRPLDQHSALRLSLGRVWSVVRRAEGEARSLPRYTTRAASSRLAIVASYIIEDELRKYVGEFRHSLHAAGILRERSRVVFGPRGLADAFRDGCRPDVAYQIFVGCVHFQKYSPPKYNISRAAPSSSLPSFLRTASTLHLFPRGSKESQSKGKYLWLRNLIGTEAGIPKGASPECRVVDENSPTGRAIGGKFKNNPRNATRSVFDNEDNERLEFRVVSESKENTRILVSESLRRPLWRVENLAALRVKVKSGTRVNILEKTQSGYAQVEILRPNRSEGFWVGRKRGMLHRGPRNSSTGRSCWPKRNGDRFGRAISDQSSHYTGPKRLHFRYQLLHEPCNGMFRESFDSPRSYLFIISSKLVDLDRQTVSISVHRTRLHASRACSRISTIGIAFVGLPTAVQPLAGVFREMERQPLCVYRPFVPRRLTLRPTSSVIQPTSQRRHPAQIFLRSALCTRREYASPELSSSMRRNSAASKDEHVDDRLPAEEYVFQSREDYPFGGKAHFSEMTSTLADGIARLLSPILSSSRGPRAVRITGIIRDLLFSSEKNAAREEGASRKPLRSFREGTVASDRPPRIEVLGREPPVGVSRRYKLEIRDAEAPGSKARTTEPASERPVRKRSAGYASGVMLLPIGLSDLLAARRSACPAVRPPRGRGQSLEPKARHARHTPPGRQLRVSRERPAAEMLPALRAPNSPYNASALGSRDEELPEGVEGRAEATGEVKGRRPVLWSTKSASRRSAVKGSQGA
ncbi:hypothetical protein KM043_003948 [Ampulex compressa]|nr:hypothetical protein KM043_003948 [Ampulex compressa]